MKTGTFEGYTKETTDILWEFRLNNNKEWYDANKERYVQHVANPTLFLAEEIAESMNKLDGSFNIKPHISRVNRDIRFSKDKTPYRQNRWFFLRESESMSTGHDMPTYFFEISPEHFRYGFGYWPEKSIGMENLRKRMDSNPAEIERLISDLNKNNIFIIEGDEYKKPKAQDKPQMILDLYNRKNITWIDLGPHDGIFYEQELANKVFSGFKTLYPLYLYLKSVSLMTQ